MMFCRRALQRVGPLAKRIFKPSSNNATSVRHMAFGVPGGSSNMTYFVLCGGGLTAAVVYAYKTVNGDSERYEDRLANMSPKAKAEAEAQAAVEIPSVEKAPPATEDAEPVAETSAEPSTEAAPEEAGVVGSEVTEVLSEAEEAADPVVEEVPAETVATPAEGPIEEVAAETTAATADGPASESVGTTAVDEVPPASPAETETAASA